MGVSQKQYLCLLGLWSIYTVTAILLPKKVLRNNYFCYHSATKHHDKTFKSSLTARKHSVGDCSIQSISMSHSMSEAGPWWKSVCLVMDWLGFDSSFLSAHAKVPPSKALNLQEDLNDFSPWISCCRWKLMSFYSTWQWAKYWSLTGGLQRPIYKNPSLGRFLSFHFKVSLKSFQTKKRLDAWITLIDHHSLTWKVRCQLGSGWCKCDFNVLFRYTKHSDWGSLWWDRNMKQL